MSALALVDVGAREMHADRLRRESAPFTPPDDAVCRVCRCTEEAACEGGCSLVTADLCSRCAFEAVPGYHVALRADAAAVLRAMGIETNCENCAESESLADTYVDPEAGILCKPCGTGTPHDPAKHFIVEP